MTQPAQHVSLLHHNPPLHHHHNNPPLHNQPLTTQPTNQPIPSFLLEYTYCTTRPVYLTPSLPSCPVPSTPLHHPPHPNKRNIIILTTYSKHFNIPSPNFPHHPPSTSLPTCVPSILLLLVSYFPTFPSPSPSLCLSLTVVTPSPPPIPLDPLIHFFIHNALKKKNVRPP